MMESVLGLYWLKMRYDIVQIIIKETAWIDNRSKVKMEFQPETEQRHDQELTKLRQITRMAPHDFPADPKETALTIQNIEQHSI